MLKLLKFLRQALSDGGEASSKRISFFILLFAFLAECAVNLIWKRLLDPTLRDQLYYAMLIALGCIFGVNVLERYKDIKIAQSNNNAATGNPTPPIATPPAQ